VSTATVGNRVLARYDTSVSEISRSFPLGATVFPGGVNFSVYSRRGNGIELLFFDREDDSRPTRLITMDPVANHTGNYWHVFVPGVQAGRIYGYRVSGEFDPPSGLRFDGSKIMIDPYGRAVAVPKNTKLAGLIGHAHASTLMCSGSSNFLPRVYRRPKPTRIGMARA
jgi:pullulanase/glycogen debranching enzyme